MKRVNKMWAIGLVLRVSTTLGLARTDASWSAVGQSRQSQDPGQQCHGLVQARACPPYRPLM